MSIHAALLSLLLATALCLPAQGAPLSAWTHGTASFFGAPRDSNSNAYKLTIDSGSCGYGDFDPRLYPFYHVVGLHKSNALVANRPMDACGSCLEIQCVGDEDHCATKKVIPVIITDQCAYDCNATTVNVHAFGFEEVAFLKYGRTSIRYRLVECEPSDPVTVHIMDYRAVQGGWIRLALKSVAGDAALVKVELAASTNGNGTEADPAAVGWMPFKNTYGAVWEAGIGGVVLPTPPLDLRVTNAYGQQLIIRRFVTTAGKTGDIETTAQFPSPYEARTADAEDSMDADSGVFVPPAQRAVPPVTVGVAIVKPVNTLVGPALNATYAATPTAVNFTGQSSDKTATLPPGPATAAGDNKPYPGGAAPTNSIVLPDDRARQGAIAAQPPPASQPTMVVPTLVPQEPPNQPPAAPNTSTPTNPQGHTPPVSIPQRTPVHKPLPTFEPSPPLRPPGSPSMQPGAGAESHGGPAAHNKADGAAQQVDPSKQVVISKNTGSRRLLKG